MYCKCGGSVSKHEETANRKLVTYKRCKTCGKVTDIEVKDANSL